jgi:drug/metabolite transporter (DMT)-like permease
LKGADVAELFGLAALWGASFLLLRMGAADFGPVALSAVRVTGAALLLVPLLALRGQLAVLRGHWRPILLVGITNTALPFLCFSYAALSISAGMSSIFNAASPLFGALVARLWLQDRLTPARLLGLAIGFAGVLGMAWNSASFKSGGTGWAVVACIAGTFFYGFSPNFTKRHLQGVPPLAIAAGSQLAASLILFVPALICWPAQPLSAASWLTGAALAFVCTGLAYILYFRLIARIGPANAITVTFLIPAFAVVWGWLFLDERVTAAMVVGCAVIVLGTALATGLLRWPLRTPAAAG